MLSNLWEGWKSLVGEIAGKTPKQRKHKTNKKRAKEPQAQEVPLKQKKLPTKHKPVEPKVLKKDDFEVIEHDTSPLSDKEDFQKRVDPPKSFDVHEEYIETPEERLQRVDRKKTKVSHMSGKRKQLLWLNPGTEKLQQAIWALKNNGQLPDWAVHFNLTLHNNTIYFEGLPLLTHEEKIHAVKSEYFNPAGQATIAGITHVLQPKYANISKSNIANILRTFETYQLNFRRRRPPKILGRMILKKPGIIMCDMFFPSPKNGWEKVGGVLTMMDAYSRYVQCYVVEKKNKTLVRQGMLDFMQKFTSLGQLPRYILCDKGTDLAPAKAIMEMFRNGRTGDLVLHSKTGKPVNLVEGTQAQIQRRMQIFATSGLTDNPGLILEQICKSINNQPRPVRGNLTPLQLLALDKTGRNNVNANYKIPTTDNNGMRELFIGSNVRVLVMTMKQQLSNTVKGFAPKWSRDVYRVKKKMALSGNINNFRYFVDGLTESFYRHELLWIPPVVDKQVYDLVGTKDSTIYEDFSD